MAHQRTLRRDCSAVPVEDFNSRQFPRQITYELELFRGDNRWKDLYKPPILVQMERTLFVGVSVRYLTSALLIHMLVLIAIGAEPAPQTPAARRPKLGVALAGGAAIGLAHVGVLQWFEENRIPIDFIAGTSMGGLVGGLHATGHSAAEIHEFVQNVDWNLALSPGSQYAEQSFRRKEDSAKFPTALEIGMKHGKIGLPSGLSSGQGVSLIINRITARYGHMKSFDDLPTPFRCVASDLNTGKGVVFEKGSLFTALRATMSLPVLFPPLRIDGMVLVDGAISNNLPVNIVKAMGADVTIAVALDTPLNPDDLRSLLGIASRSVSYMITASERPQIASADLVLMPMLTGMAAADYGKFEEFRKIGYAAAEQKATMLRRYQVSEAEYRAYVQARTAKRRPDEIHPQDIQFSGDVAPKLQASLKASMMPVGGEALTQQKLETQMLKLTGYGRFQTASYEYLRDEGKEVVKVHVNEYPSGPPFLRPTIFIDGLSGDGIRVGIGTRLTFIDLGGPASELRADFSIGTYSTANMEYYYRIVGGKWFIAPRLEFRRDQVPVYDIHGDHVTSYDHRKYSGAADLGYSFGRFKEIRLGYEIGHLSTTLVSGDQGTTGKAGLTRIKGQFGVARGLYRYDTRDNPRVALRGTYIETAGYWYNHYPGVRRDFAVYEGALAHAISISPRYSVALNLEGGTTVKEISLSNLFGLGGFGQMSALGRSQMFGNNFYTGNAFLRRALSVGGVSVLGKVYGAIGYEAGRAWYAGGTATPRHDGLIGLLGNTPMGVLFIGGAVGDQGDKKFLFRLGRRF